MFQACKSNTTREPSHAKNDSEPRPQANPPVPDFLRQLPNLLRIQNDVRQAVPGKSKRKIVRIVYDPLLEDTQIRKQTQKQKLSHKNLVQYASLAKRHAEDSFPGFLVSSVTRSTSIVSTHHRMKFDLKEK